MSRLASQHGLAGAYRDNGDPKKAVQLLKNVVAIKGRVLAEDNPSRLASQQELEAAYLAASLVNAMSREPKMSSRDHTDRLDSHQELDSSPAPRVERPHLTQTETPAGFREATLSVSPSILSDGSSVSTEILIEGRKSQIINRVVVYVTERLRSWLAVRSHAVQ